MSALAVPLLQSAKLAQVAGVHHGFTCRVGGVSQGSYASLNLSWSVGDQPQAVATNRQRVAAALQLPDAHVCSLQQVHGDRLVECPDPGQGDEGMAAEQQIVQADAHTTDRYNQVLAALVADCQAILIADRQGQRIAAVHAGWRGAAAHIAGKVVQQLQSVYRLAAADLVAACGPSIGPCCFAIGEDVQAALRWGYPAGFAQHQRHQQTFVDLSQLNRYSLQVAGIPADAIDELRLCTVCDPQFYSFRRDGQQTGRAAGVIGLLPPP